MLLLAASLLALGGCVAPGYYVQPDYAGGGYYDGGYYGSAGSYYPAYDEGCCSGSVSIGYGYGYPGYYGGSGYPYYGGSYYGGGYYGGGYYGGGYYGHGGHRNRHDGHGWNGHGGHDGDGHHWDHNGHGGDHHDGHHGEHMDGALQRWPTAQRWRAPDHAPVPHRDASPSAHWSAPQRQMAAPDVTQHFSPRVAPRSQSGASGRAPAPARSWTPHRADTSSKKEF